MSDFSRKMRKEFKRNDDIRDYGLSTPIDIIRYDNIPYGNDPEWNVLDVYRPESAGNKDLPVIVSVHGGGWIYGDKNRYQFYCMSLAQRGFAVVNLRTNFRQLLKTLTAFSPGYYLIKGSIISILQTYLPSAILRERRFWESIQISVQILNSPLYSVSVHRRDLHREPSL